MNLRRAVAATGLSVLLTFGVAPLAQADEPIEVVEAGESPSPVVEPHAEEASPSQEPDASTSPSPEPLTGSPAPPESDQPVQESSEPSPEAQPSEPTEPTPVPDPDQDPTTASAPAEEPATAPSTLSGSSMMRTTSSACAISVDSADFKAYGHATNLWGNLHNCGGGQVRAQALVSGQWRDIGSVSLAGDGFYAIPIGAHTSNPGTHQLRAVVGGTPSGTTKLLRAARPTAATAGIKEAGQATNVWGTFDHGKAIQVWTEVNVGGRWSTSQIRTANANGFYAIPLTYGASTPGTYQFRVAGRYPDGAVVRSGTVTITRIGRPTASSAGTKHVGEQTFTWGQFPGGSSIQVWTEVNVGGRWSTSQIRTASASGHFTIPLTYGSNSRGTYQFRVAGRYPDGTVMRTAPFTLSRVGFSYDSCSNAQASEGGLTHNTVRTMRALCNEFPDITRYLGYRGSAGSNHSTGRAIDVMVSGDRGWDVAYLAQRHAEELNVTEVIYQRRIWTVQRSSEGWRWMASRGNLTADHYDHVHISIR